MKTEHTTCAHAFEWLCEKIATLNRRAEKLGVPPIYIEIIDRWKEKAKDELFGFEFEREMIDFELSGDTVKLNGWRLAAVLEPVDENMLVNLVPGEESIPHEYRAFNLSCDHCGTKRRRNKVYLVAHDDGSFKRVGSSCLHDFLGHDPAALLAAAEAWRALDEDAGDPGRRPDFADWCRAEPAVETDRLIATTAIVMRRFGWVSRKVARDHGDREATADFVWAILTDPTYGRRMIEKHGLTPDEAALDLAKRARMWAEELSETEPTEYLYDLGVACRSGVVIHATAGFVASVFVAYNRHVEARATDSATSEHVGEIGERLEMNLEVMTCKHFDSAYGVRTLVKFKSVEGSILVWWATGERVVKNGERFAVRGTVKEHKEYRGVKETTITRCKMKEVD